ncbi:hypothetical protein FPOA_07694 [Fusarium poae]|uniref:Uncharacterized protein n=1 Tax=Fusarium poae TaxID=36050 RepID=A0A1B8AM08_FUSPO|nr:hypothetical protein FPOA_07694 [Fusarium poae]
MALTEFAGHLHGKALRAPGNILLVPSTFAQERADPFPPRFLQLANSFVPFKVDDNLSNQAISFEDRIIRTDGVYRRVPMKIF